MPTTKEELTMLQHLPLEVKVAKKTQQRIREWVFLLLKTEFMYHFQVARTARSYLHFSSEKLYGNDIPACIC